MGKNRKPFELIMRLNNFTKNIHECMKTKNASVIKDFWNKHAEEMKELLIELKNAGMKKEYAAFDRLMNQELYKAVLINKSIRLAKDMGNAFAKKSIDAEMILRFERRGKKIETEMKRLGFNREANMHVSLFRLHIREDRKEIASRVSGKSRQYSTTFFDRQTTDQSNGKHTTTVKGSSPKHKK